MKVIKRKIKGSMIDKIKESVKRSSRGFVNFIRIGDGSKVRIRFISDFEDAIEIIEHDKWGELYPTPCLKEHFGKDCPWCGEDMRTRSIYAWTVFDYSEKKKKILKFGASRMSPVEQFITAYDTYGTLTDRDFVVAKRGTRLDTKYSAMPLDKKRFPGKMKPFSESQIIKLCVEASGEITLEEIDELDSFVEFEEQEEKETKKRKTKRVKDEDIFFDEDEEDEDEEDEDEEIEEMEEEFGEIEDKDEDIFPDEDEEEEEKPKKRRRRKK